MIPAAMAVAAAALESADRAAFARDARTARLAALVLDTIVFGLITGVVNGVYGVTEVVSGYISANGSFYSTTTAVAWPWLTLLALLYFTVPEAMFGASIGKQVMRLKVIRLDGRPLALRDVVIRNVLKPIDFAPVFYLLGGALVLATHGAQRLGDVAAGTSVVYRHRALEPGATRTSGTRARRALVAVLAVTVLFSALFDYFGRPPLVIDGFFKQGRLLSPDLMGYSLGRPAWGFGTVTYPLRGRTATETCSGSVQLSWQGLGWAESTSQAMCVPS
jgi:uncharacterized RDD family membrane protein YckC